ncbi:MAG: ABC transporter permease [Crocinitomicaceae bacterium]|nr:ABC transporter permease [Crocinitomicaceae bacterium]
MKKILIIAKKEFLDMFRDKRTMIRMILIPLLIFPLIMNVVTRIQSSVSEKQAAEKLTVGYIENGQTIPSVSRMKSEPNFEFITYSDSATLQKDVASKKINLGILYSKNYLTTYNEGKQANYTVFYRGADAEEFGRFEELLEREDSVMVGERMTLMAKSYSYIEPTNGNFVNLSSIKEILAKYAGGMLPYIFMAFLFMGCMLPAIDLFAGEKERGTIETLLTSPVNRAQILIGKLIVVTSIGLMSATIALIGLFISLNMLEADSEMMTAINSILSPTLIATLYILLIPLAFFFAGVMIPISVYSRSFKEAQSILTPLNIIMVLPAMAGFFPGVELDYVTAFIPIVNVVLATKAIMAGNADFVLIAITFISLILLATIAIWIAFRQFGKESTILR